MHKNILKVLGTKAYTDKVEKLGNLTNFVWVEFPKLKKELEGFQSLKDPHTTYLLKIQVERLLENA